MAMVKKAPSKTNGVDEEPVITDFGTRAVSDQNFSKIVALPKQALANLGNDIERVKVELVQEKKTKFIRLTPADSKEGHAE